MRIKDFWPLFWARKVIDKLIPGLSHEADGLILQVGLCVCVCVSVCVACGRVCVGIHHTEWRVTTRV